MVWSLEQLITHGSVGWKCTSLIIPWCESSYVLIFLVSTSQRISFLSSPPEPIIVASLLNRADLTQCLCPVYEDLNFKVPISHSFRVLSSEPESRYCPSKEKLRLRTGPLWPFMVFDFPSTVWVQILIVVSFEPDARRSELGEYYSDRTSSVCPLKIKGLFLQPRFHTLTLLSLPQAARYFLSIR